MARKTHEQFKKEMAIKHPNIEILNEYVTSRTMIEYHCKLDGHRDKRRADNLLTMGCHVCSGYKKTHEQFVQEVTNKNPNIIVKGQYIGAREMIEVECVIHNYTWSPQSSSLVCENNINCPLCAIQERIGKLTKSHEEFLKKVYTKNQHIKNGEIKIKSEYKGGHKPIDCECLICGYTWNTVADSLSNGSGCPMCVIENFKGENNPNYNPNKTDEEREQEKGKWRNNIEGYDKWRTSVFKRDNHTCQCCGSHKSGTFNAHHKDGFDWCIERRLDITNGVTLCEDCHKEFHHIYGYGNNTEQQWKEFINNNNNNNNNDRDVI